MRTLKHALCGAAICGAIAVPPATAWAVSALEIHDGIWRVSAEPATGPCLDRLEFKLSVEDGQISYGGLMPVDASGSVNALGVITIKVVRGSETVAAKGLVRGDRASGEWVSPVKNCTGSWVAHKA